MVPYRQIKNITTISDAEWLEFCIKCPFATFFHTPYWADIFVKGYPGRFRKAPFRLIFDDDIEVVVPMVLKRHLFGAISIACSMPAVTYGGPLSVEPLDQEHSTAVLMHFIRKFPDLILRENPYQPIVGQGGSAAFIEDVTQTIDLSPGYDDLWKNAASSHRKCVRNAIKNGIEITEARLRSDWDAYVAIYMDSINRWKERNIFSGVRYDRNFFSYIESLDPSLRRLWVAKVNNTIVAGIVCFYWNTHAVAWNGAALAEYFPMYPNNLLYDRAIYDALQRGFRWFDCNPCGSLPGVFKFKQYIGAQPFESRILVQRSPQMRLFDMLRKTGGKK